jgi:hypothetical protein
MRHLVCILSLALVVAPVAVYGADFEEYQRLTEAARQAHEELDNAPDEWLPTLRDRALTRDLAVIEWLDDFFQDPDFQALPPDQQALAFRDRYRVEYNVSQLLVHLDRCEEARDRVRNLLESSVNDPELRPRLTEAYDSAVECLTRARLATLVVTANPSDAEVLVDGTFVGLASAQHSVELGSHTLTVRAPGYESQETTFEAAAEGQEIQIGPITLIEIAEEVETPGFGPAWYEWTLWGAGAAGIATGVGFYLAARGREDDIDNPPPGSIVVDEEGERDTVDTYDLIAIISGVVGLASAGGGTASFFIRRSKWQAEQEGGAGDTEAEVGVVPLAGGPVFIFSLRF